MIEPKMLRLINDSIKETTITIGDRLVKFNSKSRIATVNPGEDVSKYIASRNFVLGDLTEAFLLSWYRDNAKPEVKLELTEDEAVKFLKEKNYIVYKKK